MTPVSVVTGFLGSGKTTLIGRILRSPGYARTAVIVNEFALRYVATVYEPLSVTPPTAVDTGTVNVLPATRP